MADELHQGIQALKQGDRVLARQYLSEAVRLSPDDLQGWLWLSGAVEQDQERIDCLRQVLRIDPQHSAAARGLQSLLAKQTPASPPQPDPTTIAVPPAVLVDTVDTPVEASPPTASASTSAPLNSPAVPLYTPPPQFFEPANPTLFRERPSIAPLLILFWILVIGVAIMSASIPETAETQFALSLLACTVLGMVVVIVAVKTLTTRYELTRDWFSLPIGNQRVKIGSRQLFSAYLQQNWLQARLQLGDVWIELAYEGVLTQVRLHNIPRPEQYAAKINALIEALWPEMSGELAVPTS